MRNGKRRKRQKRQTQSARTSATSAASECPAGTAGSSETTEASPGRVKLQPWWRKIEGRLDYELARLGDRGVDYILDEEAFKRGSIILHLKVTIYGEPIALIARFPDFYPYVRFEVEAPELDLDHHQAPFKKNLCLIGQASKNWRMKDTLADFIKDRLPVVLKTGRSNNPNEAKGLEEHQGEPFSAYYGSYQNSTILIDGGWAIDPEIDKGELLIGIREGSGEAIKWAVLEVRDSNREVLARIDPAISDLYPNHIRCRWIRVAEPIKEELKFLDKLFELDSSLVDPWWRHVKEARIDVVGVIFPEETGWRKKSDGWIFAVRIQRRRKKGYGKEHFYFSHAGRVGKSDLAARIPEVSSLQTKKIAVIGAGGVGWGNALEFARNGVGELPILDDDSVEAGTIVRWGFGLPAVGANKAEFLANFIRKNYPYTKVVPYVHRIGGVYNTRSDLEVVGELLDDVDLIYDATAETGIQRLLSELAAERGLPYICISTTNGAWGGLIARIRPGKTQGCWMCLQYALEDESIPPPPEAPDDFVQPAGCASPTFTGTSFDIQEVSLSGVRLAVSTLSEGIEGGYPETDWDVARLTLREDKTRLVAPQWETFVLERHPDCICSRTE